MQARSKYPNMGLATIYRTLDILSELGIILKFDFGDGKNRYELAEGFGGSQHHHHLICSQCHSVQDIHFEDHLSREEERIMNETGFQIQNHVLEFFGICKECQYG